MSEQRIALEHHANLPMLDWNMCCILVCRTAGQGTAECVYSWHVHPNTCGRNEGLQHVNIPLKMLK